MEARRYFVMFGFDRVSPKFENYYRLEQWLLSNKEYNSKMYNIVWR